MIIAIFYTGIGLIYAAYILTIEYPARAADSESNTESAFRILLLVFFSAWCACFWLPILIYSITKKFLYDEKDSSIH
jgi:hypothetical protein